MDDRKKKDKKSDTEFLKKDFLGKIVEVKYNDIIKSKGKDEISLFLPRFIKIRDDKDQANSIEEI